MPRISKEYQAKILYKYYLEGHSIKAIAAAYKATEHAVYYLFKTHGLKCDNKSRTDDPVSLEIIATQYKTIDRSLGNVVDSLKDIRKQIKELSSE